MYECNSAPSRRVYTARVAASINSTHSTLKQLEHLKQPQPPTHLPQGQQQRNEKGFVPDLTEKDEQQSRDKTLCELVVTDDTCGFKIFKKG